MNSHHHLFNRGVNKNKIFFDDADYDYFMKKMKKYKEKYAIRINCFCLLPNHFHLFVKQSTIEKSIGKFIGDLTNTFTKGMNKKYSRSGVLLQGKTKSKLITDEEYYLWLCKYILNNPVKAGLVDKPEEWKYSSAQEYLGVLDSNLTDTEDILKRFNSKNEFISFISYDERKFDYSILF
jgi:REP element-mobilizing transposase RayT